MLRYFAVAAPGLEEVLLAEAAALPGVAEVKRVEGGVELAGAREVLYRANLWLRTATRVVVRMGELEAHDFTKLRRRVGQLAWSALLRPGCTVEVRATASRCRLYHTGAIAENVARSLAELLGPPLASAQAPARISLRGVDDRWTVSLDSSGELLHRRGWREETAQAPLRETLAAALLRLCAWDPATPFVDPMCGSGTLPIEAALLALGRAPGIGRRFAFQDWADFEPALWTRLVAEARAGERPRLAAPILGSDHFAPALEAARRNAERAGVADQLRLEQLELGRLEAPPGPPGLVLLNAPYGRRVGAVRSLSRLYSEVGRVLRARFGGWRAGVLVADGRLTAAFGLRPTATFALVNGGLRVKLLCFAVP